MIRRHFLVFLLISGLSAHATDSDISINAQIVSIAPITTQKEEQVRFSCVGTLIDTGTIVTASHCLPESLSSIAIQCLGKIGATTVITPVIAMRHHVKQDVAVVRFQTRLHCHSRIKRQQISQTNNRELAIYSQHSLQLHNLHVLENQTYNYIVSDDSCQTQGDSGSPVFTRASNGEIFLTAMLIAGTADCPSLQILARLYNVRQWLFDKNQQ